MDLGARPLCRRLRGRGCANCQSLPQAELFVRQRERPGLPSQALAWPPRRSAGRRESGSQRPWLGEAAPQPEEEKKDQVIRFLAQQRTSITTGIVFNMMQAPGVTDKAPAEIADFAVAVADAVVERLFPLPKEDQK